MLANLTSYLSWSSLALLSSGIVISYFFVFQPIYNVYFHPLRKYPGPKLWAASIFPWGFSYMAGNMHNSLWEIHHKYGPIARVGPNELSYAAPEAWDDVYGRYRPGKRRENQKPSWYLANDEKAILGAPVGDHGRIRKVLSSGFTTKAMLEQEPAIKKYVDLMISRLRERAVDGREAVDLWQWFVYCLFDVTGDLALGESFGCLRDSKMHPWVSFILSNQQLTSFILLCTRVPVFLAFAPVIATFRLVKEYNAHRKVIRETVSRRLALGIGKPDFVQAMITEKKPGLSLSPEEVYSNAEILTLAGAETTSGALTSIAYMLATHPAVRTELFNELMDNFSAEDQINLRSTLQLRYLSAVIEETLRYHAPGPNSHWRMTPPDGNWILGDWVPGNTIVGIPNRVLYRSESNFKRADEFIPERWLEENKTTQFAEDRRDSFHPFSYGPRNCVGMNLANAEMRYIICRIMWNFDIDITEKSRSWLDKQRSYLIWEKPSLFVYLKPRTHAGVHASKD